MTRQEMEAALDGGNLFARMGNGNLWRLRRNGKTKTWKRDASRFEIPCKAGLRATGRLCQDSEIVPNPKEAGYFIVERV